MSSRLNFRIRVDAERTGIGKALAVQGVQRNARAMTIIARSMQNLESAKVDILAANRDVQVKIISADVTKHVDIEKAIVEAVDENGSPDYLICSAGAAFPGYFMDQSIDVFAKVSVADLLKFHSES